MFENTSVNPINIFKSMFMNCVRGLSKASISRLLFHRPITKYQGQSKKGGVAGTTLLVA